MLRPFADALGFDVATGNDGASRAGAMDAACAAKEAHITVMATRSGDYTQGSKPGVLGRSAATGRYVLAPVAPTKKVTVSDQRIAAAVKSVLAKGNQVCRSFRRRRMTSSSIAPSTMRSRRRSAH